LVNSATKIDLVIASERLAIVGDLAQIHPSLALALAEQLLEKLPWDGEVNAFIKPKKVEGKSLCWSERQGSRSHLG